MAATRSQLKRRALSEMRHRAVGAGFKPAVLRGDWSDHARKSIRADALARRAEEVAGAHLVARQPLRTRYKRRLIIGAVAVGSGVIIGYAFGRWLKSPHTDGLNLFGVE